MEKYLQYSGVNGVPQRYAHMLTSHACEGASLLRTGSLQVEWSGRSGDEIALDLGGP